jgi:hypothetical protein
VPQQHVRLIRLQPLAHSADQARLADAGLAGQQHDLTLAIFGLLPAAEQQSELPLTPDQRCQARCLTRFETVLHPAWAKYLPGPYRLGQTLERVLTELGEVEQATDQAPRARRDHHAMRRRQRLQAGSEVGGLADHRTLLGLAGASQLADHDQAGRNPNASGELDLAPGLQVRHRLRKFESGLHRPFSVVLMRCWPAEIDKHTVAHKLGDVSRPAFDDLNAARAVGADERPEILGIEPRRKLG